MTKRVFWWVFAILCCAVGVYPLIYFIIDRKFGLLGSKSDVLLTDVLWNTGFYGHILLGGLALAIGWLQFNGALRRKRIQLHRNIGKTYMIAVLISGLCGIYIGFYATGGSITATGFISLGVIWLVTTGLGYCAIRKGNISLHQKMMVFSYAACFAAVTLRIWLPILVRLHKGDFIPAYQIVAWLSWVPNIIVAYFIARRIPPS